MPKINLSNQCRRSTEHKHTPAHATSNLVQITHIPTPSQPPNATASPLASFTYSHICHRQPPCLFHIILMAASLPPTYPNSHVCHCQPPCLLHIFTHMPLPSLPPSYMPLPASLPPPSHIHSFTYSHICHCQPPCLLHICHYQPPCLLLHIFTHICHCQPPCPLLAYHHGYTSMLFIFNKQLNI